jgi:hypothetical protein
MALAFMTVAAAPALAGVGIMGGGSIATVWGNDAANTGYRNGFIGGMFLDFPVNENISIRPEAMYVQKGTQISVYNPFVGYYVDATGKVDYAEFPLLVSVKLSRASTVSTVFNVGPAISVPVSSAITASGSSIGIANLQKYDFSTVIGAGLELGSGPTRFIIDFRTDIGLTKLFRDLSDKEIADAIANGKGDIPVLDSDGHSGLDYKNFTVHLSAGVMF